MDGDVSGFVQQASFHSVPLLFHKVIFTNPSLNRQWHFQNKIIQTCTCKQNIWQTWQVEQILIIGKRQFQFVYLKDNKMVNTRLISHEQNKKKHAEIAKTILELFCPNFQIFCHFSKFLCSFFWKIVLMLLLSWTGPDLLQ